MKKRIKLLILIIIIVGIISIILINTGIFNKNKNMSYKDSISNENIFNNNLDTFGSVKTYSDPGTEKIAYFNNEITNKEDLLKLKNIFLEAEVISDSITDCSRSFILEIFDEKKANSYLTDMWLCSENYPNIILVFREEGTTPGEKREDVKGLKFTKEDNDILVDMFFEKDMPFN